MTRAITIDVPAIEGKILGVSVYRGFARLCDLARISNADVYDRDRNPTGTQRDLSPKHAKEAYEYVTTHETGFWPEIVLCVRAKNTLVFKKSTARQAPCGHLTLKVPQDRNEVLISRVDGNHRLYYAAGEEDGYKPVTKFVSFCIAYGLTLEEEIRLFRDINANQRAMNTSHLDNIKSRLSGPSLKVEDRELYIAKMLGSDPRSPLHDRVYEGGKKPAGFVIPLRALKTGLQYMLSRQSKLVSLREPDAQYKVIRNYFAALKKWVPGAFEEPKKYLLLRGAGLWGVCFLGTEVIDRALSQGKFTVDEMYSILMSGRKWDWTNQGDFSGFSGRGGALKISQLISSEFKDASGVSARSLYRQIMNMK